MIPVIVVPILVIVIRPVLMIGSVAGTVTVPFASSSLSIGVDGTTDDRNGDHQRKNCTRPFHTRAGV
jgi:hypothetical protein